jgi:hypothetical protein
MNGLEEVLACIKEQFAVTSGQLTLFQIWPADYGGSTASISRVVLSRPPRWHDVDRGEIEALVGPLPALPQDKELLKLVGEQGGRIRDPIIRDVFRAVPVDSLPPPHAPYSCLHHHRFDEILKNLPESGQHFHDRDLEAGRLFLQTLQPVDLAACVRYHSANWKAIANESATILEQLGVRDTNIDYEEEANKRLKGKNRGWLWSLFHDPIVIGEGDYTNGQHRGCALRFSGADRAVVVVGTEETGEFTYPWTYQGDG